MDNSPFSWSVSAAVAVFDDDDRVLIQRRRDNGRWELPGGCVDPQETPWRAARRECEEETGVRPRNLKLSGCYTRCDIPVTEFVFAADMHTGTPKASDEASESRFVPIEDAVGMTGPVFARKIHAARQAAEFDALAVDYARHDTHQWL